MTSSNIAVLPHQDSGQVDQALEWLLHLPQLPPADLPPMADVEATVAALTAPVNPAWCMARVASLLSPYYEKDTPQSVREMEAEDWLEQLAPFPQWAVDRAVRWWKGMENPDRRKRPMEGDISARCKVEMRGIGSLPKVLEFRARASDPPAQAKHPQDCTPEEIARRREFSAQIMADWADRRRMNGGSGQ